ncbi:hypothetical protein M2418_002624 [Rhizobium sp. BIGb0125]|uniref:hypothetical protein n=1 Tax=Rhizobium sp. BIGb0125 TaxID=2940618 RepID=UPI00216937A9|nr:hypothetical protein [Rhizobium sp. BIGb0125]MCS4243093.1 hypothetical protein [Rhizobium sp. BIGb0125]
MSVISSVNSAALLILQQTNSTSIISDEKPDSNSLVSVANGVNDRIGMSAQPGQAQSKISQAMFSVNNVNVNKLKLDLIERAGKELGFEKADFESDTAFASAMRKRVIYMHATGADERINAIEKELGLDKLGVSLLDVVSSARNPDLDDKVTQALKEREGVEDEEVRRKTEKENNASSPSSLAPDEIGLYGTATA